MYTVNIFAILFVREKMAGKSISVLRMFFVMLYAGFVGTCLASAVVYFPYGIFVAPFFSIFGNLYFAAPLYCVALAVNVILDRRGLVSKAHIVTAALFLSAVFALMIMCIYTLDLKVALTIMLAGGLASIAYWNELYSNKTGFRFL